MARWQPSDQPRPQSLDGDPPRNRQGAPSSRIRSRLSRTELWRADEPLEPSTRYTVALKSDSPDLEWWGGEIEGELERTFEFTTGEREARPTQADAVGSVRAWLARHDIVACVTEAPIGSCEGCEEEVVGSEVRLHVEAIVPQPGGDFGAAHIGQLYVGRDSSLDTLEAGGPVAARSFMGNQGLTLRADIGLASHWGTDEVCVEPRIRDPLGNVSRGPATCVPIGDIERDPIEDLVQPTDELAPRDRDDQDNRPEEQAEPSSDSDSDSDFVRRRQQGCSASGVGTAPVPSLTLMALALFISLRRRIC